MSESPEIKRLLESVLARVPGATADLVRLHGTDTLREFFHQTGLWVDARSFECEPGVPRYIISAPCDTIVAWLLRVEHAGRPLALPRLAFDRTPQHLSETSGAPMRADCPAPGVIRIYPVPVGGERIDLEVVLVPTSLAAPLPPHLVLLHHDALVDGVLSRLYSTLNMPFSGAGALKLAEFHGRRFRAATVAGRVTATKAYRQGFQPVGFFPTPAAAAGMVR